jgi:hypothetical protein
MRVLAVVDSRSDEVDGPGMRRARWLPDAGVALHFACWMCVAGLGGSGLEFVLLGWGCSSVFQCTTALWGITTAGSSGCRKCLLHAVSLLWHEAHMHMRRRWCGDDGRHAGSGWFAAASECCGHALCCCCCFVVGL